MERATRQPLRSYEKEPDLDLLVRCLVDNAPPLTQPQIDALRRILAPDAPRESND